MALYRSLLQGAYRLKMDKGNQRREIAKVEGQGEDGMIWDNFGMEAKLPPGTGKRPEDATRVQLVSIRGASSFIHRRGLGDEVPRAGKSQQYTVYIHIQ